MDEKTNLGVYIRKRYEELGLTSLGEVASNIGVSRRALYNWIESGSEIKISNLLKLARVLKVHPVELLRIVSREFIAYPVHSKPAKRFDDAGFIGETIPDGSIVGSGARFRKSWTIRNIGTTTWEERKLVCQDRAEELYIKQGDDYIPFNTCQLRPDSTQLSIPLTPPGETVELAVDFEAPILPGRAISIWKMVDREGSLCYPQKPGYWCEVVVSGFY